MDFTTGIRCLGQDLAQYSWGGLVHKALGKPAMNARTVISSPQITGGMGFRRAPPFPLRPRNAFFCVRVAAPSSSVGPTPPIPLEGLTAHIFPAKNSAVFETRRFMPSRASPCLPAVYIMPSRGIRVPALPSHLHRFHDDAESPCPTALVSSIHPPIDVSPGASLVAQTSPRSGIPTVQLKARFPPRTSAARTVALRTVTLPCALPTPSTALGSMQTHRSVYRSGAFYPAAAPCTPQLDAQQQHRTPPTHIPARLDCAAAEDGWGARAMGNAPPIAPHRPSRVRQPMLPPYSPTQQTPLRTGIQNIAIGTAPQGQTHAQVCPSRDNPTPLRNNIYTVANTGIANGSHAARTRARAIRAKAKDERGRVFPQAPNAQTHHHPRSRMRMSPPPNLS
ncbi:hypothetical protein B0H14DRAFT_3664259 [Mycena olivaceomarginata]|nr:hypothetical protein B0H14DRAFT_3664259 [Mycena olivaceomarginata]